MQRTVTAAALLCVTACSVPGAEFGDTSAADAAADVSATPPDTQDPDDAVDAPVPSVPLDELLGPCNLVGIQPSDAQLAETVLIATLLPHSGNLAQYGLGMERAVALAVSEINENGGLDGRKLGVLSCDSESDPQIATFTLTHLANQGIAAVGGAAPRDATMQAFNNVAVHKDMLMISPSATSPAITDLDDKGLLWRTASSDATQGAAAAEHLLAQGLQRVALVNRQDLFGEGLRQAFEAVWCAARDCGEAAYLARGYNPQGQELDHELAIDAIVPFAPETVVVIGFPFDSADFINLAHAAEITDLTILNTPKIPSVYDDVVRDDLLCHAFGVVPQMDPYGPHAQAFEAAFEARWSAPPGIFTANAYDAVYILAAAIVSLGGGPSSLSGSGIAGEMSNLVGGPTLQVGPSSWPDVVKALAGGGSIDLQGASGNLDFDTTTGEAPGPVRGCHFGPNGAGDAGEIYSVKGVYAPPDPAPPCDSVP